jgi:hypothetical protein
MAITKHEAMGLMRDLKAAYAKALLHPDAEVNTTAAAAIIAVHAQLLVDGITPEG